MSDQPRDLVWFISRDDDGTLRYYEQYLELDGDRLVGDDDWVQIDALDADDLADRVKWGIDPSLNHGGWDRSVVAAGWVFEQPRWWPVEAVDGGDE